jgi:replication factor C small subunit
MSNFDDIENSVNTSESVKQTTERIKQLKDEDWSEKYRPEKIDDLLLSPSLKETIKNHISNGVQNMIFYSNSPGTGKTSTAQVICKETKSHNVLINTSVDGRIGTIKDFLGSYAMQMGMDGKPKVVIFDEADGGSEAFFEALRAFIELSHVSLRFILTCNSIHKIPAAISNSRCIPICFNPPQDAEEVKQLKNSIYKKLLDIANKETGDKNKVDRETLKDIIGNLYPDVRAMIKSLQNNFIKNNGSIQGKATNISQINFENIWNELSKGNWEQARIVCNSSVTDFKGFYRPFLDFILVQADKKYRAGIARIAAEFQWRSCFEVDQEINLTCGLFNDIISLLEEKNK